MPLTSQKEAVGSNRQSIVLALGIDVIILVIILSLSEFTGFGIWDALLFFTLWFGMNAIAKIRAIRSHTPVNIQLAVKMGVLTLIPLDACLAAGFSHLLQTGLLVLLLLPCSLWLAKRFAVT